MPPLLETPLWEIGNMVQDNRKRQKNVREDDTFEVLKMTPLQIMVNSIYQMLMLHREYLEEV